MIIVKSGKSQNVIIVLSDVCILALSALLWYILVTYVSAVLLIVLLLMLFCEWIKETPKKTLKEAVLLLAVLASFAWHYIGLYQLISVEFQPYIK